MLRCSTTVLVCTIFLATLSLQAQINDDSLRAQVNRIVTPYVNKHNAGVVVGVVHEENVGVPKRSYYTYGKTRHAADAPRPDTLSLYHIGSVTKTFTALVLAKLIQPGQSLHLEDTLNGLVPSGVQAHASSVGSIWIPIRLIDLATHTSSFPENYPEGARDSLTYEEMYSKVNNFDLPRAPGTCYEYSNLGVSMLGVALTHHLETTVATMLTNQVCDVIGMPDTRIDLNEEQLTRRVIPYVGNDSVSFHKPTWPAFYAAGGLYSSLADMTKYLEFMMGFRPEIMPGALDSVRIMRRQNNDKCLQPASIDSVGLVWQQGSLHAAEDPSFRTTWKDGAVVGSVSFIAFASHPQTGKRTGVVIMANDTASLQPLANEILRYLNGFAVTTSVAGNTDVTSTDALTCTAYPNPISTTATLVVNVATPKVVRIRIVDEHGALVATLQDGALDAGSHTFMWDARTSASGAYTCTMESGADRTTVALRVLR
jgi:D-alanyl-D-alanine-carboxypeptidase/D-alanyl-D-alanine-endopeptidase